MEARHITGSSGAFCAAHGARPSLGPTAADLRE
jgi:hypothetical protein